MERYKAIVVDDQEPWRKILVRTLTGRDFDAVGYQDAETLLRENFENIQSPDDQPDLVVVDLKLDTSAMQGIELIELLIHKDLACTIVAITGDIEGDLAVQAMQLGAAVVGKGPEKFLADNFLVTIQKMERLAEIGRKRRMYRMSGGVAHREMDSGRLIRPVFLSYSTCDTRIANGLRNNLEMQGIDVWYAPASIPAGEAWSRCINEAIDHSRVFVALNTDSSLVSPECIAEFMRFHRRLERKLEPLPLIIPVRYHISADAKAEEMLRYFNNYQYVDLTAKNYVGGLNTLIGRIKSFLVEPIATAVDQQGRVA